MPDMSLPPRKSCLSSYVHLGDDVAAWGHGGDQGVEGLAEEHWLIVVHVHHRHMDQDVRHVCCCPLHVLRLHRHKN